VHDACEVTKDCLLPKCALLKNRSDFQAVFNQHKRVSNRFFRILVRFKRDQPNARIGIIVSRRVSRKAVNRNRIKRQVREAFRLNRQGLENVDLVVIAHHSCETASNGELYTNLIKLLQRLEK